VSPSRPDPGQIQELLERHEGPLLAYAARLLGGDWERARDVVQDVFLRLVRADPAELGEHTPVWLFHVCRNRALDLRAKELPMLALDHAEGSPDRNSHGPLEHLEARDDAARLRSAVERLPARERELVHLKFEHGLSYQEMGTVTGLSATNVGFLLHKALRALRARMPEAPAPTRKECAT
jgi:RNA polymerase sigma factor (sigma-70 family)